MSVNQMRTTEPLYTCRPDVIGFVNGLPMVVLEFKNPGETIAQDIVRHFLGRGFAGKAMVVSIDKATALRMYGKVRKRWDEETARVRREMERPDLNESQKGELWQRQELLESTGTALIVSPAQNEIADMQWTLRLTASA